MKGLSTSRSAGVFLLAVLATGGCGKGFQLKDYKGNEALFRASLRELQRKKYTNAITGFEKLTLDLPARDTLLAPSYFYLSVARQRNSEHLLAAQTFTRLAETFPEDTLADDALFQAGMAYEALWRKPDLDATYGESAQGVFRTLLSVYPSSSLADKTNAELSKLDDWFARKDYETANHYMRRKAYDSAILYYRDVIKEHPTAPHTRLAYLRLLEAYRQISYKEEAAELCQAMRAAYATDREVRATCEGMPVPANVQTTPTPTTPNPATPIRAP
jgi:outer membrane protein assembly factor BamD